MLHISVQPVELHPVIDLEFVPEMASLAYQFRVLARGDQEQLAESIDHATTGR